MNVIFYFTDWLVDRAVVYQTEYESLEGGLEIREPLRSSYFIHDRKIRGAYYLLDIGRYDELDFLSCCSHHVGDRRRLHRIAEDEIPGDPELPDPIPQEHQAPVVLDPLLPELAPPQLQEAFLQLQEAVVPQPQNNVGVDRGRGAGRGRGVKRGRGRGGRLGFPLYLGRGGL